MPPKRMLRGGPQKRKPEVSDKQKELIAERKSLSGGSQDPEVVERRKVLSKQISKERRTQKRIAIKKREEEKAARVAAGLPPKGFDPIRSEKNRDFKRQGWKSDDMKIRDESFYLDEIEMPSRPIVMPSPALKHHREVFASRFPDDEEMKDWIEVCGPIDHAQRIPSNGFDGAQDRGYVRFKHHEAAVKCIEMNLATWSESELALKWQKDHDTVYSSSELHYLKCLDREKLRRETGCLAFRIEPSKFVMFWCRGSLPAILQFRSLIVEKVKIFHEAMRDGKPPPLEEEPPSQPVRGHVQKPVQQKVLQPESNSSASSNHWGQSSWSWGTWGNTQPQHDRNDAWNLWHPQPYQVHTPWIRPSAKPSQSPDVVESSSAQDIDAAHEDERIEDPAAETDTRVDEECAEDPVADYDSKTRDAEDALTAAVLDCITSAYENGNRLTLSDLQRDPKTRACRCNALPRKVTLKDWIESHLSEDVILRDGKNGQVYVYAAGADISDGSDADEHEQEIDELPERTDRRRSPEQRLKVRPWHKSDSGNYQRSPPWQRGRRDRSRSRAHKRTEYRRRGRSRTPLKNPCIQRRR